MRAYLFTTGKDRGAEELIAAMNSQEGRIISFEDFNSKMTGIIFKGGVTSLFLLPAFSFLFSHGTSFGTLPTERALHAKPLSFPAPPYPTCLSLSLLPPRMPTNPKPIRVRAEPTYPPPPSTCLSWKEWRRRGRGLSFCLLRNVLHSLSLSSLLSGPFPFLPPLPCLSTILVLTWKGRKRQGRSGSWKRGRAPRNRLNTSAAGGSKRSVGGTASPPPPSFLPPSSG